MTGPTPLIIDLSHLNEVDSFHAFQEAGIIGAIFKSSQGVDFVDPKFDDYYQRAVEVFGSEMVAAYHFLDDSDPEQQAKHFLSSVGACKALWLDYEPNPDGPTCQLQTALTCCQTLQGLTGKWNGMYGSDRDLLGAAIDAGHFSLCTKWLARYSAKPTHHYDLWQFAEGVEGDPVIAGGSYDLSTGVDEDSVRSLFKWMNG